MSIILALHNNYNNSVDQYIPTLHHRALEEYYSADNVTVTVEWTQQLRAVYDASVLPLAPLMEAQVFNWCLNTTLSTT